jgi:hypothetical protein
MSDSEIHSTYISFASITKEMEDVLEFKKHVDGTLKNFSDSINALSSSILLYKKQLKKQLVNDSICSSDNRKKKFCSNVNNNNVDECNNNNNKKTPREYSLYYQTDKEGKEKCKEGKTELEKARILLQHHLKKLNNSKRKKKKDRKTK